MLAAQTLLDTISSVWIFWRIQHRVAHIIHDIGASKGSYGASVHPATHDDAQLRRPAWQAHANPPRPPHQPAHLQACCELLLPCVELLHVVAQLLHGYLAADGLLRYSLQLLKQHRSDTHSGSLATAQQALL
jgi:hypothetical protein